MRAIFVALMASAALGGAALAQGTGTAAAGAPQKTDVAPIQFDLSGRQPRRPGNLPTATTLDELTYASETPSAAQAAPRPKARLAAKPRPAPKPARKAVVARTTKGPWMSEWRRAYIARHGHQPPVRAR